MKDSKDLTKEEALLLIHKKRFLDLSSELRTSCKEESVKVFLNHLNQIAKLDEIILSDLNENLEKLSRVLKSTSRTPAEIKEANTIVTFYFNLLAMNELEKATKSIESIYAKTEDPTLKALLGKYLFVYFDDLRKSSSVQPHRVVSFFKDFNKKFIESYDKDILLDFLQGSEKIFLPTKKQPSLGKTSPTEKKQVDNENKKPLPPSSPRVSEVKHSANLPPSVDKINQAILLVARNLDFFIAPLVKNESESNPFQQWAKKNQALITGPSSQLHHALQTSNPITLDSNGDLTNNDVKPLRMFIKALIGEYTDQRDYFHPRTGLLMPKPAPIIGLKDGNPSPLKDLLSNTPGLVDAILSFEKGKPNPIDQWYQDMKINQRVGIKWLCNILSNCPSFLQLHFLEVSFLKQISVQIDSKEPKVPALSLLQPLFFKVVTLIQNPGDSKKLLSYMESLYTHKEIRGYLLNKLNYFIPVLYKIQQQNPLPIAAGETKNLLTEITNKILELDTRMANPRLSSESRQILQNKQYYLKMLYTKAYALLKTPNVDKLEELNDCIKYLKGRQEVKTFFYGFISTTSFKFKETGTEQLINKVDESTHQFFYTKLINDNKKKTTPPNEGDNLLVLISKKIIELDTRMNGFGVTSGTRQVLITERTCLQKAYIKLHSYLKSPTSDNLEKLAKQMLSLQDNESVDASAFSPSNFFKANQISTRVILNTINSFVEKYDNNAREKYIYHPPM